MENTKNESSILSGDDQRNQEALIFAFVAAFSFLAPCICLGNALTIFAVYKNRRLRTPTYLIHTSLALTDLLTCFLAIPLEIYVMLDIFVCPLRYASMVSFTSLFFGGVSFLHAFAITADRYIAITRPLQYSSRVTNKRVGIAVAVMWCLNATFFAIRAAVMLEKAEMATLCFGGSNRSTGSLALNMFNWGMCVAVLLLILTLVVANARILQVAMKQSSAVVNQTVRQNDFVQHRSRTDGLKAVKTTTLIVGVFIMCWFPILIWLFYRLTSDFGDISRAAMSGVSMVLMDVSSAVNPVIYYYTNRDFRRSFSKIFRSFSNCPSCRPTS